VRDDCKCAADRTFPFNLIHSDSQSIFDAREVYRRVIKTPN
jgi:hypothetical protein